MYYYRPQVKPELGTVVVALQSEDGNQLLQNDIELETLQECVKDTASTLSVGWFYFSFFYLFQFCHLYRFLRSILALSSPLFCIHPSVNIFSAFLSNKCSLRTGH